MIADPFGKNSDIEKIPNQIPAAVPGAINKEAARHKSLQPQKSGAAVKAAGGARERADGISSFPCPYSCVSALYGARWGTLTGGVVITVQLVTRRRAMARARV